MIDSEIVIGHVPSFAYIGSARKAPTLPEAKRMCEALISMIRRQIGDEPPEAKLVIQLREFFSHRTFVVVCNYSDTDADARAYAFRALRARDADWDQPAKQMLRAG